MALFLTRCALCIGCISVAAGAVSGVGSDPITAGVDRGVSGSPSRACLASAACRSLGAAALGTLGTLALRAPGGQAGGHSDRASEVEAAGAAVHARR